MKLQEDLERSGYSLDSILNVWKKPDYSSISYSDGDEVERRLSGIVENAEDLSVFSEELRQKITDWPSLYHFSPGRSNIIRPLNHVLKGADVLEIGAGCGAITRYLGEAGANIIAVEGSTRRAAIARSRTRDLSNVTVVAERFNEFQCQKKFDVVTLIGVIEYAPLFTPGEIPAKSMLERVRTFLKPEGFIIIAVENQLGLKYFAGAPEDHIGLAMYGLEGRYTNEQPCTYGRKVLANLLVQSGYKHCEFIAPFPDYKFSRSLVTEVGFSCREFDSSVFPVQSVTLDPQMPSCAVFSPELTWPTLVENGLGLEMANSFVIVAHNSDQSPIFSQILAYHYSTERMASLCKETRFLLMPDGSISVESALLAPEKVQELKLLEFSLTAQQQYHRGHPLSYELIKVISRDNWNIGELGVALRRYLGIIQEHLLRFGRDGGLVSLDTFLPGEFFDLVPQNIMVLDDRRVVFFDREWQLKADMQLGWLIFRALLLMLQSVTRVGIPATAKYDNRMTFFKAAFSAAGYEADDATINHYAQLEAAVQAEIRSCPVEDVENWWADSPLPMFNLHQAAQERDKTINSANQELGELKTTVTQLTSANQELGELKATVTQLTSALEESRATVNLIKGSLSWKLTAPLRLASRQLYTLVKGVQNSAFGQHRGVSRLSFLCARVANGLHRHGCIRGIPAGIRVAWGLLKTWASKRIFYKKYYQRIGELQNIIKEHNGFVDIFHVPMGWSTPLFQRFQHMSLQVVELGGLALYGGHTQVDKDMFVYKRAEGGVIVFDALDKRIVESVFQALAATKKPIVLRLQSIDLATKIEEIERFLSSGIKVVYEYIDEISEDITGGIPDFVYERHAWILDNPNVFVVATSEKLFNQVLRRRQTNCLLSTNGVDLNHWRRSPSRPPSDLQPVLASGLPVLGYHGALARWIDYDLLRKIAESGLYELLLIGYEHDKEMRNSGILNLERVHFLGSKSYFELNDYVHFYSAGIIPFKLNELTESVSPVKLFEYMAALKPIVTTNLPECLKYKSCFVSDFHDGFLQNIAKAIFIKDDKQYLSRLRREAEENSWLRKAEKIYAELGVVNNCSDSFKNLKNEGSLNLATGNMNQNFYQFIRKIYWNLPLAEETKERIVGTVRRAVRKGKMTLVKGNPLAAKEELFQNYAHQILAIPAKPGAEYVDSVQNVFVRKPGDPKLLAYYLPQFHPIEENDRWWGKGVTEWNNVSRAVPQYVGHYQPRLPGELGYYDLRIAENLQRQIELAKFYGIYGFSFYYYWFDGVRLLEKPLDMFVETIEFDFPFCLCWANESWTRRFDGSCGEILMKQSDTTESYRLFIDSVIPYMRNKKYIRVDGRPLLNIYRPSFIPNCSETLEYWRKRCIEAGIGDIYIIGVREHTWDVDLLTVGFDGQNEFHPGTIFKHCKDITDNFSYLRDDFSGRLYDYADLVENKKYFRFNCDKLYRAVMPMWDNTARRDNKGMIFEGSTPELYKQWLEDVFLEVKARKDLEEPFVFINAWNEWGEGAYLEPDRKYGYAYLDATLKAIENTRV